jgi:nickel-dependent lactate racemase
VIYFQSGSESAELSSSDLRDGLFETLSALGARRRVIAVPPDFTRFDSRAGELTVLAWEYYKERLVDILPAIGTHAPMTGAETAGMFPGVPPSLFRVHDWRRDAMTVGTVPGAYVAELTEGAAHLDWHAQLNRLLFLGGHDLILSMGQVIPHEVMGMAGYNKNLFIGTGGADSINQSHFISASYGMERLMGRADNPLRSMLNYASRHFIPHLPVVYALTVIGRGDDGALKTRGLFIGDDEDVFVRAAELSLRVNVTFVEEPLERVVAYLDPATFKSTWIGNKAIYRTRMAMADGGELIVLAPGVSRFGEDPELDALIRKYGYRGTAATLRAVAENEDLSSNMSAAAHLIHGSSEGRFTVIYCPGKLMRREVEAVGFGYEELGDAMRKYDPEALKEGWNVLPSGERVYFISKPALGLWAGEGGCLDPRYMAQ